MNHGWTQRGGAAPKHLGVRAKLQIRLIIRLINPMAQFEVSRGNIFFRLRYQCAVKLCRKILRGRVGEENRSVGVHQQGYRCPVN